MVFGVRVLIAIPTHPITENLNVSIAMSIIGEAWTVIMVVFQDTVIIVSLVMAATQQVQAKEALTTTQQHFL